MKISDITCTPLAIGKGLLRVATDAGVEGWAEVPGRDAVFEAYLDSVIRPSLVGADPRPVDRHWETLALGRDERSHRLPGWVVGVIDVALWDLLGKETGLPVHTLMGGARRTAIPLYWSTGLGWRRQPEEMLAQVRAGPRAGLWRVQDPHGLARLAPGRGPGEGLSDVQAGCVSSWTAASTWASTPTTATRWPRRFQQGRRFEELGIDHFEEPIPHYDLPGLRQVADALDVAVSAGRAGCLPLVVSSTWCCSATRTSCSPTSSTPAVPSEVKRIYELATVLNKPVMPHSPQAGINSMASLHVYATVQNATRPARVLHRVLRPARRRGRPVRCGGAAQGRGHRARRRTGPRHRAERSRGRASGGAAIGRERPETPFLHINNDNVNVQVQC